MARFNVKRVGALVLIAALAFQPLTLYLSPSASPVGTASADIGVEGSCVDDAAYIGGSVLGGGLVSGPAGAIVGGALSGAYTIGSNLESPCWKDDTVAELNEEMDQNQTYDEALRVIDVRSNEERLIDSLLNTPEFSKEPIRQEAELTFAEEYMANVTETEAIGASKGVVDERYDTRHADLARRYNRDMRNARDTYTQLQNNNASDYMTVYAGGSALDTSGGITFSVPVDQDDTENGTAYDVNGESVQIATVTVAGTTYTFQDNISITVDDPAGEMGEVPVVGRDLATQYGANAYHPSDDGHSADTADMVIAEDGSGTYSTLSGIQNANSGDVIYVKAGTYVEDMAEISTSDVTLVLEPKATIEPASGLAGNQGPIYLADGSSNFVVKGGVWNTGSYYAISSGGSISTGDVTIEYATIDGAVAEENGDLISLSDSLVLGSNHYLNSVETSNVYFSKFDSFTSAMIDEQESDRSEIKTALGDTSSGYLHDVWNQLETEQLAVTDILTYEQMFGESFSEDVIGSRAWLDAQYMQAGMSGHDLDSTAVVEVQSGSTVFANAQKSGASTLESAQTYEGHLWTMSPPTSGSWEANTTYNTNDLGGQVFVTYQSTTETMTEDGIVVETEPATVAIEGEFRITEMINESGESVTSVKHSGTPNADPYNASAYADQIEQLNQRIGDLQEEIEEAKASGGSGSGTCGIQVFGVCSGITSAYISWLGIGIVIIVGGYLFRPVMEMLANLTE